MKNVTFSFAYHHTSYLAEVTKSEAILPIHFTAHLLDAQLQAKYGNLLFTQKNNQSPIESTRSSDPDDAELKEIILQRIMKNMKFF